MKITFTLLSLATCLHAATFTYNNGLSNPSGGTFVYEAANVGIPYAQVTVTQWDDSASGFTGTFSNSNNNPDIRSTAALDPGDYICFAVNYFLDSAFTASASAFPEAGYQLATSLRIDSTMNGLGDDAVMIFNPNGNSFNMNASGVAQAGDDNSTANVTGNGLSSGFTAIDALTGGANTTYYTFAAVGPDPQIDSEQKATIRDNAGGLPNTETTGYTWYLANTGTDSIAADTSFRLTFNGQTTPIPEPSASFLLGLGALGLLTRRKRS